MYTLQTHALVENDIKQLDHATQKLVFKKLQQILHAPELGKPLGKKNGLDLSGYKKVYVAKKRVRIVYEVRESKVVVFVIAIGKREDMEVYKSASKRK